MTRRFWMVAALLVAACATLPNRHTAVVTLEAQTLPLTVKLAVDPDANVMGYIVQLDMNPATDVGLPAQTTCQNFVGGSTSACVPFSVSIAALGSHTVKVIGYNLGGSSPAASITFNVSAPPGNPNNGRVTK